eukprot:5401345-Pyramimonas_sp.AAC.1
MRCLGTLVNDKGSMGPEVAHRIVRARGETRPIQRALGKRDNIPLSKKAQYSEECALSSMYFNMSVWSPLSTRASKRLASAQCAVHRAALGQATGNRADDHRSQAEVPPL